MGISKEEAIKELQTREMVYVAYSQATKLPYVKKGGTLVYSTCSVLKDENVRQAEKFLGIFSNIMQHTTTIAPIITVKGLCKFC